MLKNSGIDIVITDHHHENELISDMNILTINLRRAKNTITSICRRGGRGV